MIVRSPGGKRLEGRSGCKQHRVVGEGFHLQRVAAGVTEEHRSLFAGLSLEADGRRDREFGACGLEPFRQVLPVRHRQHHAEMRHRHAVPVDMVVRTVARFAGGKVRDDLVAVEIEIDPFAARPSFGATHRFAIEAARRGEVVDGEGEVEGPERHVYSVAPAEAGA